MTLGLERQTAAIQAVHPPKGRDFAAPTPHHHLLADYSHSAADSEARRRTGELVNLPSANSALTVGGR